ncbi:MAG: hypothetical protein ACRDUA_13920 [Micromonosporaceae bacterium]
MRKRLILAAVGATLAAIAVTLPANAADRTDTVRSHRATVRDAPARLVLANALHGDRVRRLAYCGSWVRIRMETGRAMATRTGWVMRGNLTRSARKGGLDGVPRDCAAPRRDHDRWRDHVVAMNSPFSSARYIRQGTTPSRGETERLWRHVKYPTRIAPLTGPECVPSYNHSGGRPDPAQRISGLDLSRAGYRYLSRSGVALVSVARASGGRSRLWGFVPASCVRPDTAHGYTTVYYPHVVRLSGIPSAGVRTADLRKYGCRGAVPSPVRRSFGWWPDPQRPPGCPY